MAGANSFPIPKFFFSVKIEKGGGDIRFREITGLDQEFEYLEFRASDSKDFVTEKRLGLIKTGTISMKRGVFSGDSALSDIFSKIYDSKAFYPKKKDNALLELTISLKDEKGSNIVTWYVNRAIPVKFVGTELNSESNEISVEQIDFVHSGIKVT